MNVQLKKGILELCVLSVIQRKDTYGYEIVEQVSNHINISEGTIYPMLKRFAKEGYVTTYLEESQSGPPRKYYQLSQKGKDFYTESISEWLELVKQVEEIIKED